MLLVRTSWPWAMNWDSLLSLHEKILLTHCTWAKGSGDEKAAQEDGVQRP